MDRGEVTSLILLDSYLLLLILSIIPSFSLIFKIGLVLMVFLLNWFTSYLSSRSQAVSINDSISAFSTLSCGVPQGSILGPLLFTFYTTPLGSVISKNSLKYQNIICTLMYTQLYISFTPMNSALSFATLTPTFTDILSWMNLNKLLLNPSKTEFLLIGTKQQRLKFSDCYKLISQQWYHPSQFLCSQSWLHLWLWHVFLWSNQLCIQILSFSHPRHPSNSSSSSSFCSHSPCKFTCLQQTWLL